jgi:hypothetical protein
MKGLVQFGGAAASILAADAGRGCRAGLGAERPGPTGT